MSNPERNRQKQMEAAKDSFSFANPKRLLDKLDEVLVISDTHWFHERLHTVLAPGVRPHHNHGLMLERWYETVGSDDVVLHLGDVAVGITAEEMAEQLPLLPGTVYLVPGNHDSLKKLEVLVNRGWKLLEPFEGRYHDWNLLFTHEPCEIPEDTINVHGHIHQNLGDEYHLNCSVEQLDYRPVSLTKLLEARIQQLEAIELGR